MGRITGNAGRGHRCRYIGGGIYEISWRYDVKYAGSRLRFTRGFSRDTDEAGARRFCKRWGCAFPALGVPRDGQPGS